MSISRMLSWFPSAWRDRYEAEVRELIEAHPFGWRERRDLLGACADAWARELWSWAYAIARMAGAVGIRIVVVLAVGWIGLQLVYVVASLEATRTLAEAGGLWVTAVTGFRNSMALMILLFVARPYADTGSSLDRPSWTQVISLTLLYIVLAALDDRVGPVRQLPDLLMVGVIATMRYARWFGALTPGRPAPKFAARIIGLQ